MVHETNTAQRARLKRCITQRLDQLPVLPVLVTRLMALDRTHDDFPEAVLDLIGLDPTYAARVLSAANSAASAPAAPITTLRHAIMRIGSGRAVDLVTAAALTRLFAPRDAWEKSLWRHSIQVAVAARELARYGHSEDISPDEVYPAALLHDIGRLVMFAEAPDLLRFIDEGDWDTPERLVLAERAICGLTHTELGAAACRIWGIPDSIRDTVRDHHDSPTAAPRTKSAKNVALIRLADLAMFPSAMPGTLGLAESPQSLIEDLLMPKLPPFLAIDAASLHELVRSATAEAEVMVRTLGLGDDADVRA